VWRWDQAEPFGDNPADEDPDANSVAFDLPLRLPGQRYDKETGLHYNYFRDYDPSIGRYGESDPIGLRAGLNTYSYVLGNPLSNYDPKGLEVRLVCRPLAGALGATGQQHCYVFVSCPAEGWSRILSLFATDTAGTRGRKSLATSDTPTRRDDPDAPGNTGIPIIPSTPKCDCACEKEVMDRFLAFPSGDVPYFLLGPNSNSFAQYLITSSTCGTGLPMSAPTNAPGFGFGWPGFGLPSQ
jgi:RHS repeat-associated protein